LQVSSAVAGFVLPLGVDFNLDGSGVYYPLAVLFLGFIAGLSAVSLHTCYPFSPAQLWLQEVDAGTVVLVVIISTVASIGSHHSNNSGIILMLTIWQGCFVGKYKVPW
jgi:Na+/H+-dicarboxylate symporter